MTVGDMLARMSSSEVTEWMAYLSIQSEPDQEVSTAKVIKAMFSNRVKKKAE
jgi:hypothetical protein